MKNLDAITDEYMKDWNLPPCYRKDICELVETGNDDELFEALEIYDEASGPVDPVKFFMKFGVAYEEV